MLGDTFVKVGALAYRLNKKSVAIQDNNGHVVVKLINFSEASLVRERDRLDSEKVSL